MLKDIPREAQGGFRKERSMHDHVFTLKMLTWKALTRLCRGKGKRVAFINL